ncbi:hypothetical protein [Flavobacterium sp.]|uniref:hypothetical protein n=1 Tax=Flavobacterium sp. TaxID=239 RepID=UPI004047CF8B
MKTSYTILCLLLSTIIFSQENGNWDYISKKDHIILLDAGQNKNLSIDLPPGTSKVFYTIRAMKKAFEKDELSIISRELSKSPTPNWALIATESTNIAIGMNDAKVSYNIIAQSDNSTYNCKSSSGIVTSERCYIDYSNKNCLDISGSNLKLNFNFKSENKFFGLRIVFELVAFVDNDLKRGWSLNRKNFLHENLVKYFKSQHPSEQHNTIEKYVGCILMRVEEAYTYKQFELLTVYEKDEYIRTISSLCRN